MEANMVGWFEIPVARDTLLGLQHC